MATCAQGAPKSDGGSRHVGSTPMCRGATISAVTIEFEVDGHGNREKDLR
jgi:hypothetical protein